MTQVQEINSNKMPKCISPQNKCDKVFKIGPSKTCGRLYLKNLKGYGLPKQSISRQIF